MRKKFFILILVLSLAIVPLFFVSVNTYAYETDLTTGWITSLIRRKI